MQDQSPAASRVRFGPYELDLRSCELRKGPTRLKIPDQSIQVLKALLDVPGELVTREQLQQRLWPSNTFVDFEHGLNVAIRRLREALGDSADEPKYIETLPRRGYRFVGRIDGLTASVLPPPMRRRMRWWPLAALAALVLATGVGIWLPGRGGHTASAESAPSRTIPITSMPGLEVDPALSPDGNHVAFAWQRDALGTFDVYVKLIDGGDPVQLTRDPAIDRSPAWSPDGRRIAFVRGSPGHTKVMIIPAFGGSERVITETDATAANGVSWTLDGKSLVVVDRAGSPTAAIFLCSIDTGERRQLTHPSRDFTDTSPAVSPDGRYLAFVRRIAGFSGGRVFVQHLDQLNPSGEPRQLTPDLSTNNLDWAPDSESIFYDTDGRSAIGLSRVSLSGGEPVPVLTNVAATHPSLARDGSRLLYSRTTYDTNIWKMPGPRQRDRRNRAADAVRLIASTSQDRSPQFSARGDKVAFASNRSGTGELWVCLSDGSQPMPLAAYGGSPRWSADGQSIAFDSMRSGSWNIYVVRSQGGAVHAIAPDQSHSVRASWSGDGKWIYFGSNRSGDWQIWKAPAAGGAPVQITMQGGWEAFESFDGKYLYYAKRRPDFQGIWRVPVEGGREVRVVDHGVETSWGLTEAGIVLLNQSGVPQATMEFFDFATGRIETIARLPPRVRFDASNPSLAVSRDGQWILYVLVDDWGDDIQMLRLR